MANYKTIYTTYGLAALTAAEASGVAITLTHMAVGDGNGNAVTPSQSQTGLVREMYRSTINRITRDPIDSTKFTAELVVPATEGGFTLREVGLFDSTGSLFAVGNLPATYKPADTEGAYSDTTVRMVFVSTNATVVNLYIDPNVTLATQSWIENNITAATIIPGGTTHQVLRKINNTDGNYEWADPTDVNIAVDIIEESQTLSGGQTVVTLATCTTIGLAVYIEGVRLIRGSGADQWDEDPTLPATRLILGQTYPAGSVILFVQNEPLGNVPYPLQRDLNLSDLLNVATARTNMSVYSKAESLQLSPVGMVAHFPQTTAPSGWLKCNGAAISRTTYAALYAIVGTSFGVGDGFSTFNVPDLRGEFIRGWDDGRGVDAGRALGSVQAGALGSHTHTASTDSQGSHSHGGTTSSAGSHAHGGYTNTTGAHNHTLASAGDHVHSLSFDGSHVHTYLRPQYISDVDRGGTPSLWSLDTADYGNTDLAGLHTHAMSQVGSHTHAMSSAGDHAHTITTDAQGTHTHTLTTDAQGVHSHAVTVAATGSTETRPRNLALLACIRY